MDKSILPQNDVYFSELGNRIRLCATKVGGYDSLCAKTGIPKRTMSNYVAGQNDIKSAALVKIADVAGVSLEWLATGAGTKEAPKPREMIGYGAQGMEDREFNPYTHKGTAQASSISRAGGPISETPELLVVLTKFIAGNLLNPAETFAFYVRDDSMEPTIRSGDLLICSKAESQAKQGDGLYVLKIGDSDSMVKRTQITSAEEIEVISDNSASYQPLTLKRESVKITGKVVFVFKKI